MGCKSSQREFVARHVDVFIKRHWEKLNEVCPEKDMDTLIQESGNTALIEADKEMSRIDAEIRALIGKAEVMANDFQEAFGDTLDSLVCNACTERSDFLEKKQKKFEYRIRTAIGLCELVSPEAAYEVLESCRSKIEDLKA